MILGSYVKKPAAEADYDIDFAPFLRDGETLTNATATAACTTTPADVALTVASVSVAVDAVRVRLAGGTAGETYSISVTTTTSAGRIEPSEFTVAVELPVPSLTYHDAYLAPLVTPEREARALADVDEIATFPAAWRSRLAVVRAYIITATESQRTVDDLFGARVKRYREEWSSLLPLARAAADAESGAKGAGSLISIPLERA